MLPKPRYSWLLGGPAVEGVHTLMEKLPKSMAAAWQLGRITARLELAQPDTGGAAGSKAIQQAAALLRMPADRLSADDLLQLGDQIAEFEARRGVAARLAGALSFVNLMWAGAILGIAISVGPALAIVCTPAFRVAKQLLERAAAIVANVAKAAEPLWEVAIYAGCLYIIGAAQRYSAGSAGLIAATGCALALPAFMYSSRRHLLGSSGDPGGFAAILNMYLMLVLAPTAVTYQSKLLGMGAAAALFGAVGFSVVPHGLCWCVGFGSGDAMARAAATSSIVLSALVGLRVGNVDSKYIKPFRTGLSVLGGITLFLSFLIRSSLYYSPCTQHMNSADAVEASAAQRRYLIANGTYLALLVASAGAGSIYGMPSLSNTAATFFLLWAGEKGAESAAGRFVWLTVFGGSIALWQVALFLHSRPDFLAAMVAW